MTTQPLPLQSQPSLISLPLTSLILLQLSLILQPLTPQLHLQLPLIPLPLAPPVPIHFFLTFLTYLLPFFTYQFISVTTAQPLSLIIDATTNSTTFPSTSQLQLIPQVPMPPLHLKLSRILPPLRYTTKVTQRLLS